VQAVEEKTQEVNSPRHLAKRLGVCTKTARKIIHSGKIRAHLVGGQWRIFEPDLQEYLARQANRAAAT
jgi:excisionase family DNA binding protein